MAFRERELAPPSAWGVDFLSLREQVDTSTPMGRAVFTIIAAISELERETTRERVIAGVRRAQAAGKHCGRPRVEMDLRPALALLKDGRSLKETSRILNVSRNTLRRRLREAGAWREGSYSSATKTRRQESSPSVLQVERERASARPVRVHEKHFVRPTRAQVDRLINDRS